MSRYDKETIAAKFEWEGSDAIEWFDPTEVPEEVQDLWQDALNLLFDYKAELNGIYDWLYSSEE